MRAISKHEEFVRFENYQFSVGVDGEQPVAQTKSKCVSRPIAQSGRASGRNPEGRGFESRLVEKPAPIAGPTGTPAEPFSIVVPPCEPGRPVEAAPLFRLCGCCGEPIARKRLQARPEAKYCIECQPQFDRLVDAGAAMAVMSEMDGGFEQYMGLSE